MPRSDASSNGNISTLWWYAVTRASQLLKSPPSPWKMSCPHWPIDHRCRHPWLPLMTLGGWQHLIERSAFQVGLAFPEPLGEQEETLRVGSLHTLCAVRQPKMPCLIGWMSIFRTWWAPFQSLCCLVWWLRTAKVVKAACTWPFIHWCHPWSRLDDRACVRIFYNMETLVVVLRFWVIQVMVNLSAVSYATGLVSASWKCFTSHPRGFFSSS